VMVVWRDVLDPCYWVLWSICCYDRWVFTLMRRSFLKGLANRLGYVCIRKVVSNLKGCSLLDGTN
jgi:hypothetical protein